MGVVYDLLKDVEIPQFYKVSNQMDPTHVEDVAQAVRDALKREGTLDRIKPGTTVCFPGASREIANIVVILRTIAEEIKRVGATPYVVPGMGSHGGATAEGQRAILEHYGITEETVGCEIHATMETGHVGYSAEGLEVRLDAFALSCDYIIPVGRIKPHTDVHGPFESGIMKMLAIGMGKQYGASICHQRGFGEMHINVPSFGRTCLANASIPFAIGIVENAFHQTHTIAAIPNECVEKEEPELLLLAKSLMDSMDGMMAVAPTFELKEMYGQQAITAPVVLYTPGEPEAQLQLEGQVTAFYRGEDLIEVWTCYPGMANYLFDQEATDALSGDLEALEAFEASLDFSLPQEEDDGIPDAFVNFLQDKEEPETQQQSPHMTITADDGTFRMDVPVDTTVIHAGSDEDAVARARTLFADVEGGEECFDLWYQDVQSLNCWLLISREQRVAAQVYVNEAGSFKGMTAEDMLQLEQPVLEMMQQQYDHAELSDESCVAEIAGKEHSMMTYSLDKSDMHLLTFVMAAVDEVNLYELDVYAIIDEKTDTDAVIETVTMMIESLEYLPELGV